MAVTLIGDMDSSKRQVHVNKKDPTRSITYRLSEKLVSELETEANQKGVSQNVLVKQILEKYVQWDRFSQKIGLIPVPVGILQSLGDDLEIVSEETLFKRSLRAKLHFAEQWHICRYRLR